MSLVWGSLAWNQHRCSFRSSRVTVLGSRFRRFCRLIRTSNLDQSGSRGRAAGLPAGGSGDGSPACCRPRLSPTLGSRMRSSELPTPLEAMLPRNRFSSVSVYCSVVAAGTSCGAGSSAGS
eukprot:6953653-Pyramimonas_sp.AAC.1